MDKLKNFSQKWSAQERAESFLDAMDSNHLATISRRAHIMLWTIVLIITSFIVWASLAKVDEITRGIGKIIPSGKTQVIQHFEGGIIRRILVKEGDKVINGQPLMHVDNTQFDAKHKEGLLKQAALEARVARLEAQIEGKKKFKLTTQYKKQYPEVYETELSLFRARMQEKQAKTTSLRQRVNQTAQELAAAKAKAAQLARGLVFARKELNLNRELISSGATSKVELLRLEREVNTLEGELEETRLSIPRLRETLAEAKNKINELEAEMMSQATQELTEAKSELSQVQEGNKILYDRSTRSVITSPVNGTVNVIHVNTVGGVIRAGADIIEIVPSDGTLLVEAKIQPSDVAFLRPELKAVVKSTAYDYVVYGGLDGKLELISPDTTEDEQGNQFYTILVRTDKDYLEKDGEKLGLFAGMQAEVDIITGKKSVLSYLVKPLVRAKASAFRER